MKIVCFFTCFILFLGLSSCRDKDVTTGDGERLEDLSFPVIPEVSDDPTKISSLQKVAPISPKRTKGAYFSLVHELYRVLLERPPQTQEAEAWINTLSQGAALEGVYRGIVLGSDYQKRSQGGVNKISELKPVEGEWLIFFSEKFLARRMSFEDIKKFNKFKLRQEFADRALEVMDAFGSKEELARWYAFFSVEVAKRAPKLFREGTLRTLLDLQKHYSWAQRMPEQDIKFEFLVKFYSLANHSSK
jgi:hypothetical protein